MASLLVTNDFPPKIGGIQSYLHELWRRLPPGETTVLTAHGGAHAPAWDAQQAFRVERVREPVLLPTRSLARRIDAIAREVAADVIFLDPWLPLGALGPRLRAAPYVPVLHGAEVTVPARLPVTRAIGARVLRASTGVVAAGNYVAREAARLVPSLRGVVVPPGVDVDRFRPLDADARAAAREAVGLDPQRPLVLGVSRLVPRKGFDILVDAVALGAPGVTLAIGGKGRDARRLARRIEHAGIADRARMLGRVPEDSLAALCASADVFAMPCRSRWLGLEAEGYGIVFVEAAAAGVPVVAGRSGGSHEAVLDGVTGVVVDGRSVGAVGGALARLLRDDDTRRSMGVAARRRAVDELAYEHRVAQLAPIAAGDLGRLGPLLAR